MCDSLSDSSQTGLSKGVATTHRNSESSLLLSIPYTVTYSFSRRPVVTVLAISGPGTRPPPQEGDVGLLFLPLAHIFGLLVAIRVVSGRARTVIMEKFDLRRFCEHVQRYKITVSPLASLSAVSRLTENISSLQVTAVVPP